MFKGISIAFVRTCHLTSSLGCTLQVLFRLLHQGAQAKISAMLLRAVCLTPENRYSSQGAQSLVSRTACS